MKAQIPRIREIVGRTHDVAPDDEKALTVVNTEVMFSMMDSLFSGVNFLIWLVGIGTALAGAIGVSNIMMVTVRERTTEIGIRRAIGATPRMILSQIITESILLTLVAGMSGIIFGVLILQMLQTRRGYGKWSYSRPLSDYILAGARCAGLAQPARCLGRTGPGIACHEHQTCRCHAR